MNHALHNWMADMRVITRNTLGCQADVDQYCHEWNTGDLFRYDRLFAPGVQNDPRTHVQRERLAMSLQYVKSHVTCINSTFAEHTTVLELLWDSVCLKDGMPCEWCLMHPPYRKLQRGERVRCTQLFQYQFDPLTGLCIRFVRACQPEEYDLKPDDEVGDHYVPPGQHPDRLTDAAFQHRLNLANYVRPATSSSYCSTPDNGSSSSSLPGYASTSLQETLSPMFKFSHDELLFQCETPLTQSFLGMDDIIDLRSS